MEQLVSMCRWSMQDPITHILDLMYDLMKIQRKLHGITSDSPTKVRKRAVFPVSTRLLNSITEVMLHVIHKIQTFYDHIPKIVDFDYLLATDSNPAVAAGHIYDPKNLKEPMHVVTEQLLLQYQESRPETMHQYKGKRRSA